MGGSAGVDEATNKTLEEIAGFQALHDYDFSRDIDFQAGLASILGHSDRVPSPEEISLQHDLVLQAQCFYYARKFNVRPLVDWQAYKDWLKDENASFISGSLPSSTEVDQRLRTSSNVPTTAATGAATQVIPDAAPYPTSFSHIVDLITRSEPVPGIEQIPDTILDADMSQPNAIPKRKKPWEAKVADAPPADVSLAINSNGIEKAQ